MAAMFLGLDTLGWASCTCINDSTQTLDEYAKQKPAIQPAVTSPKNPWLFAWLQLDGYAPTVFISAHKLHLDTCFCTNNLGLPWLEPDSLKDEGRLSTFYSSPSNSVSWGSHDILTQWGRMIHICVSTQTIIGSDNGLSPDRRQAIIWTNAGILLIRSLGKKLQWNQEKFLFIHFHSRKCVWKCRLENGGHFVSASVCYNTNSGNNYNGWWWLSVCLTTSICT